MTDFDILQSASDGVLTLSREAPVGAASREKLSTQIGRKGSGLAIIPFAWTPPFLFVDASVYCRWLVADAKAQKEIVDAAAVSAARVARSWPGDWDKGIAVRSSATEETLSERGANATVELAADFDGPMIGRGITQIYEKFASSGAPGQMAVVVQARVQNQLLGHISNEVRVSKTINQWMWELEPSEQGGGRFNSQREQSPDQVAPLALEGWKPRNLVRKLRQIGRWSSQLGGGRTHLEWGATGKCLWLFQLDFEDDQNDDGVDPTEFLRAGDYQPPGSLGECSPLQVAKLDGHSGWPKIDKAASFAIDHQGAYPTLIYISGAEVLRVTGVGYDLTKDLDAFAHGRIVCRTDCTDASIKKLNLPRTHTTSSQDAVDFMLGVLEDFKNKGAKPENICFILHKFIPSVTAAWAMAKCGGKVVRIDSLWGLPDGLQYLPHDSFEFDTGVQIETAERPSYKNAFLQETATGDWEVVRIKREATRWRSLPIQDLSEVANRTQKLADRLGKDIQVMWFCRVPPETGLTRNIPWFSMAPSDHGSKAPGISPSLRRFTIAHYSDLDLAIALEKGRFIINLEPHDPELFRSQSFLDKVVQVAIDREVPVAMTGSILAHAFYVLEKAGLSVIALNEPRRTRTRQRKIFRKLVRDYIPRKITEGGETVTLAEIAKEEARSALIIKLFEEGYELLSADTPKDVIAELADILEVVRALASTTGVEWADVVDAADQKKEARGGFERSVVLLETSSPAWLAEARETHRRTIPLELLGQITVSNGKVNVPFPLLVGAKPALVLLENGTEVVVTMDGTGIHLKQGKYGSAPDGQLTLPFLNGE